MKYSYWKELFSEPDDLTGVSGLPFLCMFCLKWEAMILIHQSEHNLAVPLSSSQETEQ